jgi:hypothetical protein
MRPYRQDSSCKQDGSICICSGGYAINGVDKNGYNMFQATPKSTACQQWRFKVGDVILVEKPAEMKQAYVPAYVVAAVSNSPVVHVAIVTKVPPLGVNQTADNVIVTEALKGAWKRVLQNSFREIVERFPFGGISIRRIDEKRFPRFFSPERQAAITQWGDARVGDGFDQDMLIPLKRRFAAGKRYVSINPDCKERKRALKMYKTGGPGKWICSEFVGWTLAFAGGINSDYGLLSSGCDVPTWTIKNIQPLPGELTDMSFFDPKMPWHMPCEAVGCFVGVPAVPEWNGGTTTTTTLTTTITSTTTSTSSSTTSTTTTTEPSTTVPKTTTTPATTSTAKINDKKPSSRAGMAQRTNSQASSTTEAAKGKTEATARTSEEERSGKKAKGPGTENAKLLPPWWILNHVKPAGPDKDKGSFTALTFSKEQQSQFHIDESGKVLDQDKFEKAIKAYKERQSKAEVKDDKNSEQGLKHKVQSSGSTEEKHHLRKQPPATTTQQGRSGDTQKKDS